MLPMATLWLVRRTRRRCTCALDEVKAAKREGRKLQTVDEFIKELRMEEETV